MFDHAPYIAALRARQAAGRARAELLAQEARGAAQRISAMLVERYGATRVVLIGSLARGAFRESSDIDLVVAGLPCDGFYRAGADAERLAGRLRVDIVPEEGADEAIRRAVEQDGVVLYGE